MDEAKEHFMAAEQVNTKQSPNRKGMEKSKQKKDRRVPKENGQKIPTKEGIEKSKVGKSKYRVSHQELIQSKDLA